MVCDLRVVEPTPQADTDRLRRGFPRIVDERRATSVRRWCEWIDQVLGVGPVAAFPGVLVHGDLHSYNQVWDQTSAVLLAVVDFEESGIIDPHFDLRYLPGSAPTIDLMLAVVEEYERLSMRRLTVERVMAWNVLTVLGDALWRTEAGVALPDPGGTAATWVDDVATRLEALDLG